MTAPCDAHDRVNRNTAQTSFTFPLPKSLPSGQYLVRVEQIALHVASTYGGAQWYISYDASLIPYLSYTCLSLVLIQTYRC